MARFCPGKATLNARVEKGEWKEKRREKCEKGRGVAKRKDGKEGVTKRRERKVWG